MPPHPCSDTVRLRLAVITMSCLTFGPFIAHTPTAQWSIDPKPMVTLGTTGDGSTAEFAFVTGATILPDKNIMVGDRSDYSMFIVSPTGKTFKKFGRKGSGPGELTGPFFTFGNRWRRNIRQ